MSGVSVGLLNRSIIRDDVLLLWALCTVLAGVPLFLVNDVLVRVLYGCWIPWRTAGGEASACLGQVSWLIIAWPIAGGLAIGTWVAVRVTRAKR
jgi:hypothetical protein